jgi:hypothetical protein
MAATAVWVKFGLQVVLHIMPAEVAALVWQTMVPAATVVPAAEVAAVLQLLLAQVDLTEEIMVQDLAE